MWLNGKTHMMAGCVSNYTWNWLSGCQFIIAVHPELIMKSRKYATKPFYASNEFHPQSHRVYLALSCSWIQSSPGKPSQSQARYSLQPQTSQVSRTGEHNSMREQSSPVALISCSKPHFPGCGNPSPQPPPLLFHCLCCFSLSVCPQMWLHTENGHQRTPPWDT